MLVKPIDGMFIVLSLKEDVFNCLVSIAVLILFYKISLQTC